MECLGTGLMNGQCWCQHGVMDKIPGGGGAVIVKAFTSTFAQHCSNGDLTSPIDGGMYNVFCSFAK